MNTIHQPSFDYTESILKSWMDKGVRDIADVKALDLVHMKEKAAKKTAAPRTSSRTAKSKFNNFEGRKYQDRFRIIKTRLMDRIQSTITGFHDQFRRRRQRRQ